MNIKINNMISNKGAYSESTRYYSPEDGEVSLSNPVVWNKLIPYVYSCISRAHWIYRKDFTEASDILLKVLEDLKDIPLFKYGNEHMPPIVFLMKKIWAKVAREWEKYVRDMYPRVYDEMKKKWKNNQLKSIYRRRENPAELAKFKKSALLRQKKYIEQLDDNYILPALQNDLSRTTGMKFTFNEIRTQFPELISNKKQSIIRFRIKREEKLKEPPLPPKQKVPKLLKIKLQKINSIEVITPNEADVFYMLHIGKVPPIRYDNYEAALDEAKLLTESRKKSVFITKAIKCFNYKTYIV